MSRIEPSRYARFPTCKSVVVQRHCTCEPISVDFRLPLWQVQKIFRMWKSKHCFRLSSKKEILRRDPRCKLLLDGKVRLIPFSCISSLTVASILQVTLSNLHALSQDHLFWANHLQHVCIWRNRPRGLEAPKALMRTTSMIFHEFLSGSKVRCVKGNV